MSITNSISKLSRNNNLSYDEMSLTMEAILRGNSSLQETVDFLKNLTRKGESDNEVLAMLDKMDEHAIHISPNCKGPTIDVCGTGGDKMHTFNVSTTASFVIAACGGYVAKHGNRSMSGVSGSADIFEHFGYNLNMDPSKIENSIEKFGIGFMFAQRFHPAMKNVSEARKMIGTRTIFNLLGPLCNPAKVKHQLVGVFSQEYLIRVIKLLQLRGTKNVMTVISEDGLDELSITGRNHICQLKNNTINEFVLDPYDLGLPRSVISDIQVRTKEDAVQSFFAVLKGTANKSMINITALNAAAGLIVGDISDRWDEAVEISLDALNSGRTHLLFKNFIQEYGDVRILEEMEKN